MYTFFNVHIYICCGIYVWTVRNSVLMYKSTPWSLTSEVGSPWPLGISWWAFISVSLVGPRSCTTSILLSPVRGTFAVLWCMAIANLNLKHSPSFSTSMRASTPLYVHTYVHNACTYVCMYKSTHMLTVCMILHCKHAHVCWTTYALSTCTCIDVCSSCFSYVCMYVLFYTVDTDTVA